MKTKSTFSSTSLFYDAMPKIKTRAELKAAKNLLVELLKVHHAQNNNDFWQLAHMAITMIDVLDERNAFDERDIEVNFDRFSYSEDAILYFRGYAWNYQSNDIYFYCTTTHGLCYCRFNAAAAARVALDALKIQRHNLLSLKSVSVFGDNDEPNYPHCFRATNRKVALMACAEYQTEIEAECKEKERNNATMTNSETSLTTTNAATPANWKSTSNLTQNSFEEELNELTKYSTEQLTAETKIYLGQHVVTAIEIGKRLIVLKNRIGHGNWGDWLKENFNLSQRTARQFMQIYERFGANSKWQTSAVFNYSQMAELLALPAGEEENFIAEKAAEGNPVEKMTVKQEREEIKKYKAKIAQLDNDNQKLQAENKQLADIAHTLRLENEAFKDQEPQVIETVKTITPPDYVETVQRAEDLQQQVDHLLEQNEQAQKTIDDLQEQVLEAVSKQGEPPTDYLQLEKKLSETQTELVLAKLDAEHAKDILAVEKYIEQLFQAADALYCSSYFHEASKNYLKKHPNPIDKIAILRCICEQLNKACDLIYKKTK